MPLYKAIHQIIFYRAAPHLLAGIRCFLSNKTLLSNRLQRDFTLRIDRLNHNFKKNLPESNFQERQEAHGNNLGMTL